MRPSLPIILASHSPRRRELMSAMDIPFTILENIIDVDESYPDEIANDPHAVVRHISQSKARAYTQLAQQGNVVITADTIVAVDNNILGKPQSPRHAHEMLKMLSGRSHMVITAVTISTPHDMLCFDETTLVTFAPISDTQIDYYIDHYHPFDKAGAYGIQEWIGQTAITKIDGCFYNVMGLPTAALYHHLKKANIISPSAAKKHTGT